MTDNLVMNVHQEFNTDMFIKQLAASFRAERFNVNVVNLYSTKKMQIKKNCSGIKNFFGLGQGININCSVNNGVLNLGFSDGNWLFKFVSLGIGILFGICLIGIPFLICSIVGIVKQSSLPNKISDHATMIVSQMTGSQQISSTGF